ncbi:MAG: hypothetical protein OHK0052_11020 [Anaerolineales bacterium]
MYQRILNQIQAKIEQYQYVMTLHAEEEMSEDGLSIVDVEHAVLTGKIIERQKDVQTGEWKYLIAGNTVSSQLLWLPKWVQ